MITNLTKILMIGVMLSMIGLMGVVSYDPPQPEAELESLGVATAVGTGQGGTSTSTRPTMGQLLIGNSSGTFSLNTLTAGSNITITNATNSITIDASASAFAWTPRADGNATTTRILLDNGFISSASSTIASTLDINGLLTGRSGLISSASSTFASTLGINGLLSSISGFISSASSTVASTLDIAGLETQKSGFISSASSTIASSLQVAGQLRASSSLSVGAGTALGSTLSVTGTSTMAGLSASFGTFSSNLVASSLFDATGLSSLTGGFISSASSSIASTLDLTGLLTSKSGFISSASSTVASTLKTTGLLSIDSGFISSASSTIAGNLSISGVLRASSTATSTIAGGIQLTGIGNICTAGGTCLTTSAGGSSNWTDAGDYLTPATVADGIIISASSTFSGATTTITGVFAAQKSFSLSVPSELVATGTILTLRDFNDPITIKEVHIVGDCSGTCAGGVTLQFYHGVDRSASTTGTTLFSAAENTVGTSTGRVISTFNDNTLTKGEWLTYQATDASSTPDTGFIATFYYITP